MAFNPLYPGMLRPMLRREFVHRNYSRTIYPTDAEYIHSDILPTLQNAVKYTLTLRRTVMLVSSSEFIPTALLRNEIARERAPA